MSKKFVLKLDLHDGKEKKKALKTVSALSGIDSIAMDMKEKKLTVIGVVDPITTVSRLRKYWPTTDLISVGPAKEPEKPAEKKEEGAKAEDGKKEEGKKEGGDVQKKEEGKKEGGDEKKEGGGGDDKKKDEKKAAALPVYDPMWEVPKARGGYIPHMFPYNPHMTYYSPHHMTAYNPPMISYNPPMNTYYAHSMEENPTATCTIS